MNTRYVVCLALVLSACEVAPNSDGEMRLVQSGGDVVDDPAPTPSPSATVTPTPSPSPVARKSLLSTWARFDSFGSHNYTVDLSELAESDLDSGPGITVEYDNSNAVSFYFSSVQCISEVWISGTEDNGTLEVRRSNSGMDTHNMNYCYPLRGIYNYTAMSDGTYRLEKSGVLSYWQ